MLAILDKLFSVNKKNRLNTLNYLSRFVMDTLENAIYWDENRKRWVLDEGLQQDAFINPEWPEDPSENPSSDHSS